MEPVAELAAGIEQPGQTGVGGLGDLTLDIEVEERFGSAAMKPSSWFPKRAAWVRLAEVRMARLSPKR